MEVQRAIAMTKNLREQELLAEQVEAVGEGGLLA